jgi:hypothetical protein
LARNSSKQWTPEDDKRLLELEAAGKSRVMIAAALRRSPGSIPARLYILRGKATISEPMAENSQ